MNDRSTSTSTEQNKRRERRLQQTPEQREAHNAKERERRFQQTPEQREAHNAKRRERQMQQTAEKREAHNAERRERQMQQTTEQREAHNAKRREQRSQQTPEKREVQNINRCIDYQSFPQTQIQARLRAHLSRIRQRPKRLFPYDIRSPGIPESPVLNDFECNVDSAAALLWERSGIYRFRDLFYKCDEASVIHPEVKCELEAHNINSGILERCINGYNNYMSPFEIDICYCAVCNIRTFERKEHCAMSVESLPSILLLSEDASNMFYSTPHNFRLAFNVFQHTGHLYFLNPSLLFTDICGNQKFPICEQCNIALYPKKITYLLYCKRF